MSSLLAELLAAPHDRPALRIGPGAVRTVTCGEWRERAAAMAATLPRPRHEHDFLAVRLRSNSELPFALLAAWMRGLALLPLPAAPAPRELEALYAQCGRPAAEWHGLPEAGGQPGSPDAPAHGGLALLLATSGTSAAPKVFGFTHRELFAGGNAGLAQLGAVRARNVLNLRPAFTSGGTNTLWPAFLGGGTLSFAEGPYQLPRREALATALAELAPSLVVASPAYLRALCAEAATSTPLFREPLPLCYGGLRLRAEEHEKLRALGFLPEMRYGMTECAHVLSCLAFPGGENEPAPGLVGPPAPGVEVKAQVARLSFRAAGFASVYFEEGKALPALDGGDFYHSDDLGALTPAGLRLEGREHAQLVVAGFRVAPAEVEACLLESGLLADCAVGPVRDGLWQERVGALVVPAGPAENLEHELRAFCRGRLSAHKVPAVIVVADGIPVLANGKRDLAAIRAKLG